MRWRVLPPAARLLSAALLLLAAGLLPGAVPVLAGVTETPSSAVPATPGLAVEGSDHARVLIPAGVSVEPYADAGYTLTLEPNGDGQEATVEVDLTPLGSAAPFHASPPAEGVEPGPVEALARSLTEGISGRYDAVSAILGWMVHHLVGEETAARFGGALPSGAMAAAEPEASATGEAAAPAGETRPPASRPPASRPPASRPASAQPPSAPSAARPSPARQGEAAAKADDESAAAVLARGSGSSQAIARLAVALLGSVGIDARTVRGEVVGPPEIGSPHGSHTWIEVRFPRLGWVPSDPLYYHHYVPATYVRLPPAPSESAKGEGAAPAATPGNEGGAPAVESAAEVAEGEPAPAALQLVERRDRRQTVDLYPAGGPGVTARKNDAAQHAGALRVVVSGAGRGSAVLEGAGGRRSKILVAGESVFVGLEGGLYQLEVYLEGRPPIVRRLEVGPRERRAVFLREDGKAAGQGAQGQPGPPHHAASRSRSVGRSPRH